MNEEWRDVVGFEGLYKISNLGVVKSVQRLSLQNHIIYEKIIKPHPNNSGYLDVSLYKDGKRIHKKIHRMVAEAFIPNPNNLPEVDHIDADKNNNCVDNLHWVTHSENHLNPLTVKLKSEINKGKIISEERRQKISKRINVFKDGILLHTFNSYKDLDVNSKKLFGVTLWNVYARKVINGIMDSYHGYTFTSD